MNSECEANVLKVSLWNAGLHSVSGNADADHIIVRTIAVDKITKINARVQDEVVAENCSFR